MPKRAGHRGASEGRRNLVALGSAAVLAIYAAGYMQTQSAADRFASESAARRPASAPGDVQSEGALRSELSAAVPTSAAPSATEEPLAIATPQIASVSAIAAKSARALGTDDSAKGTSLSVVSADAANAALSTAEPSAPPPVVSTTTPSAIVTAAASGAPAPAPAASAPAASAPAASAPAASAPAATTPVSTPTSASATTGAPATAPSHAAAAAWRDGFFFGRGTSRHGDIEAMVEIKDGRIASAVISQCLTRYSCSWIAALPAQVVARQSADVDYVSGATQSANAFYYAIVEALKQAK